MTSLVNPLAITDEMIEKMFENFRIGKELHQRFVDAGLAEGTFEEALTRIICRDFDER